MTDVELRAQLEREHPEAFGWALACCRGQRDDAEEVMQSVYLSVLDGSAQFDARSSFRTWLFGVVRLTAASKRRSAWVRSLLLDRKAYRLTPDAPRSADAQAEASSRAEQLRAALGRLASRQREVLQLVFYHEMTVEEAARVMGVSVGSARTHYARGKARMAELLGRGGDL
jgi:RNA polymerase sigma factor (sigma-70 family)